MVVSIFHNAVFYNKSCIFYTFTIFADLDILTVFQQHFVKQDTSDGTLKLKATIGSAEVMFTYTLDDNDMLMVHVTGTSSAATSMNICVDNKFNLNSNGAEVSERLLEYYFLLEKELFCL